LDEVNSQAISKESIMADYPAPHNDGIAAWWQRQHSERELTKLECGLLGALSASMVLVLLLWLGSQLSIIALSIQQIP
jgi:hypothetical protein